MSQLSDAALKNRLEHGIWLDEIERSYRAWREAPNAEKPPLLLTGMVLTWAESWRLTHPEDFTPAIHTYIARSLATQSIKTSAEREAQDIEIRRRDRSYQQILLLMALFAIVVLGPSAMRIYAAHLDKALGIEPAIGTATQQSPQRTIAAIQTPIQTQEPLEETPPPAALQWPPQRLIAQARTEAAAGRHREAALFALEALDAAERTPADAAPADIAKALSVIANLRHQATAMPQPEDAAATPVQICSPQRYATVSTTGETLIVAEATKTQRIAATHRAAGALNASCSALLKIGEDYDVKLHTLEQRPPNSDKSSETALESSRQTKTLGLHEAAVVAARFSGDDRRIITVSRDAVGKVWDAATGKRIASFRSEAQMFNGASISHDGAMIVTWSDDKTAELWDGASGKRLGALVGHQSPIVTAEFSRDGATVLTVSADGSAIAWTTATRAHLSTIRPKSGSLVDATLSPDGRHVVAHLEEDRVLIWPLGADKPTATLNLTEGKLQSVVVSRDSRHLAILETSGIIGIYGLSSGQRLLDLNAGDTVIGATFGSGNELTAFTHSSAHRWPLPLTRETAVAISQSAQQCWSAAERLRLKLNPGIPAWCTQAATASDQAAMP